MQSAEIFDKLKEASPSPGSRSPVHPNYDQASNAETGNVPSRPVLPCRIEVKVKGVEAFLYNQTPIYDNIIANLTKHASTNLTHPEEEEDDSSPHRNHSEHDEKHVHSTEHPLGHQPTHSSNTSSDAQSVPASKPDRLAALPAFLTMFPIQIECKKAAAAVGNEHTPSIVTAQLDQATGRIDADEAGQLDLYKLLFKFDFTNVKVALKSNNDFQMYQLQAATQLSQDNPPKKKKRSFLNLHIGRRLRKLSGRLQFLFTFHSSSKGSVRTASLLSNDELLDEMPYRLPGEARWQGLARYLDAAGANEHHEWDDVEYARFSQIVDCPKVKMKFYWDVPGKVHKTRRSPRPEDVNGADPPEYGLDLAVEGGTINYGPWADRQRVILQKEFFPVSYCDARPEQRRSSNQIRLATVFKLFLCIEEELTLRVPTREPSKDWQWQGKTETHRKDNKTEPGLRKRHTKSGKKAVKTKKTKTSQKQQQQNSTGVDVRPFGWIDVKVLADTTVNYTMDMYAREDKFCNSLDLDVKGTEIFSSVNHAMLWRAGSLALTADLSNPLGWNALRKWAFNISCQDLDLFILRDHMFLITDLVADWSSGPPPDFYTFTPFHYGLDMNFNNFNLYLNGNDANIVNDPSDLEENNFLVLRGEKLHCGLDIPIDQYRPAQGEIKFDVTGHDLSLDLENTIKSTLRTLLRDKCVATLKKVTLNGTQTYFSEQAPGLTDVLMMDICGTDLELRLFGFLIRYFINVKENYFGEFLHFKTLEEYQNSVGVAADTEANVLGRHTFRPANDLDVILCIKTEQPVILLPSNIYSADSFIRAELPVATVDLRVTNYYLDLQTDVSPIAISLSGLHGQGDAESSRPQLLIDFATITGHRLFGLPPTEPCYAETWNVEIGKISGDCSLVFVENLAKAGRSFVFAFGDMENALPFEKTAPISSVMFLTLNVGSACLWINGDLTATRICADPIKLSQNDRASSLFSGRMSLILPNLTLTCVEADAVSRHRLRRDEEPAQCMAFIQTSVDLNMVSRKANSRNEYLRQQQHVREQDARTRRAQFLLDEKTDGRTGHDDGDNDDNDEEGGSPPDPPAIPLSGLPEPLFAPTAIDGMPGEPQSPGNSFKSMQAQAPSNTGKNEETPNASGALPSMNSRGGVHVQSSPAFDTANLWSPFASPDDHFSNVNIDLSKIPTFTPTVDQDDDESIFEPGDGTYNVGVDDDSDQQTFMIKLHPGVRVYVEPRMAEPILKIVEAVLPKGPTDTMDKFQLDVMGLVEEELNQQGSVSKIVELNLIVPTIDVRLCNNREGDMSTEPSDMADDQLDLKLSYLNFTLRQRKKADSQPSDSALILHLTLESALAKLINISADNLVESDAIRLGVDDVLVWLVLSRTRSVHVSFKDLLTVVSGRQTTYLASVFSKYAVIGTSIQRRVDAILHTSEARLRYLADYLTSHSSVAADPPYLSRMTYILRAFPDHFRNQDSWKIVARFRHIYDGLTGECRAELEDGMSKGLGCTMKPSEILDQWAEWCSWDIPNMGKTHVFKMLLGDSEAKACEEIVHPLELTVRSETVRVAVDSATKSSDFSLGGLSLGMQIVPPSRPSGLMLIDENLRTKTIVQAHTALVMLRLHWELLDQADDLIDIYYKRVQPAVDLLPDDNASVHIETDESIFRQDVHVVLSNDRAFVELDTQNLHHVSQGEDIKISAVGTSRASEQYRECFCVMITAHHASSQLSSKDCTIYRTDLDAPSIYLDYRQRLESNAAEINLGGSYGQFSVCVEQEVLGLLETVDTFILDEVNYIKRLQERVADQHRAVPSKHGSSHDKVEKKPAKELHFNVAFLAGKFTLTLALLQALNLSIIGDTTNLRVKPLPGAGTALSVETQLGEVEYALVRKEDGKAGQRAVFHTPPASVLVGVQILEKEINLGITAILKEIKLEATSVQSALTILNRPEVQSVLEAIRDQISDLRQRITEILIERKPVIAQAVAEEAKIIVYDVKTTLAGLKVVAHAPATSAGKARAELSLGFGNVRATLSNVGLKESKGMPNVSVNIEDIGAVLTLVENGRRHACGDVSFGITVECSSEEDASGRVSREVKARSDAFNVNVCAETACTIVDIIAHVQRRILDLDLTREVDYLRRLRHSREKRKLMKPSIDREDVASHYSDVFSHQSEDATAASGVVTNFNLDLRQIRVVWVVAEIAALREEGVLYDLELSLTRVHLTIHRQNEARLSIEKLQLQAVPKDHAAFLRAENSALLPEVVFTVRYATVPHGVKVAFKAVGQALELKLDAGCVLPLSMIHKSLSIATSDYYLATANWRTESSENTTARRNPFGDKRLVSLQADARFDGSYFYIQGDPPPQFPTSLHTPKDDLTHVKGRRRKGSRHVIETTLRAPGMAIKVEFTDDAAEGKAPVLNGEVRIDASSNTIYPQLVPIILQISDNVKEVVRKTENSADPAQPLKAAQQAAQDRAQDLLGEDSLLTKDPSALIGKTKLNLGLRICQQEIALSCQPIARVNAKAHLEDIYITVNTIDSEQFGHFFALSATLTKLGTSVQHVYSRESTFSFDMESIALSLMNSKHLGAGASGVSAVLKIAPTRTALNVRQIQDLLLFREIWFPDELTNASAFSGSPTTNEQQEELMVQKYQQVSAAAAFPWSATVSIANLAVDLDLGQSIGKSSFSIKNMWACSKKSSTWKQDLCVGLDEVGINSTGRMSGFVELEQIAVRTSIEWPAPGSTKHKAPLIQAAAGFGRLRAKSSFDYQPFGFVDIEGFNLLMYNVRDGDHGPDRLVAILDGDKVFAFFTATSAAQAVGLYQAFDRLVHEKKTAYAESLRDLEKQLRRRSVSQPLQLSPSLTPVQSSDQQDSDKAKFPITLHTDVVVKLGQMAFGAFPATFFDNQILKLEASDVSARFAVGLEDGRIHSDLGMTLGRLQAALASVRKVSVPKTLGDISIDEVIANASGAKGGTILRVPRLVANMQTWQQPANNQIDYLFKSLFEGKVDVGWNYSRISYIRSMWNTHSKSLATRLGKALPESALKIRSPPSTEKDDDDPNTEGADNVAASGDAQQGKITAVVNVPQSRYEYRALEPPIIETPQLRDMGEATPPLEWIGLHRDRLPNVTHQIVIVTLLEIAKEVEDAYDRILGSS